MLNFTQLVSIKFQGLVVVFGRTTNSDNTDIYYNVLGNNVDVNDENLNWSGFTKLEIPQEVRQAGMGLLDFKSSAATLVATAFPFRVISDQNYIIVIQQSAKGTLYVNRFRLLETRAGSNQKSKTYTLSPAWEVRYSRSQKESIPADKADSQEYLAPDGSPFLEPSIELSMIGNVTNGAFDVLLLPISGSSLFTWQFFILDSSKASINLFNFPATTDGLFDVAEKPITAAYQIAPDSTFSLTEETGGAKLAIKGAPRAALYTRHEKIVQPDGTSIGVRRAARIMIALPVSSGSSAATATVDSAISLQGQIAELRGDIVTAAITPAPSDLVFNGVDYLSLVPPASGGNPLSIAGAFTLKLMILPASLGEDVLVIGGDSNATPATQAPYLKIVDSDKLEVGFGDGTAMQSARTLHQVLVTGVWSSVCVTYSGPGETPFHLTINDSEVPLTPCKIDKQPAGTAITHISQPINGFKGALNNIVICAGDKEVLRLAGNTINYDVTPPTTPDSSVPASGVIAQVYGPKLEASSSPVNTNMSGNFYIDNKGLTYYAALAKFIQPHSSACLMDGSDGLLHLYFQGENNLLSVAQCSTQSARATFYTGWTTDWKNARLRAHGMQRARVPGLYRGHPVSQWHHRGAWLLATADNAQSGFLNFVANRIGTYMNSSKITVTSSAASPLLCDIHVQTSASVGEESWTGLPRNIEQLAMIWNGSGKSDPDDPDVLNQKVPYFDYQGTIPTILASVSPADSGGYFLFTSVPSLPLTIASLTVSAASVGKVNITIEISAPATWAPAERIVQYWPDVPAAAQAVRNVFTGKSTNYDYSTVTTAGTMAWPLPAATPRSDEQVSNITLFVKTSLSAFSLTVQSGRTSSLCQVSICGFSLPDVPRNQQEFAATLNGVNTAYRYPDNYISTIAGQIYALTDGLTAEVLNCSGAMPPAGPLAYSGLFRTLYIGSDYDQGELAPQAKTEAAFLQSTRFTVNGKRTPQTRSTLFSAINVSVPTNGGHGRIENTAEFSNGTAAILEPGVNGGWMPQQTRFCLAMNQKSSNNFIQFDVNRTKAVANELALLGDMTVGAWINQDQSKSGSNARVLNYNVSGNLAYPNEPVQYMAGATRGPALLTSTSTFVRGAFNFAPPSLSVQIYVRVAANVSGRVFTVAAIRGSTEYVSLNLNSYHKPEVNFLGKNALLSGANPLPVNVWTCITLTIADAGSGNVTLSLYINADNVQTLSAANTFSGNLGALTVGHASQGLPMAANGVAFWQRALSATEVQNSVDIGFPDNDNLLGIRWNLSEGSGAQAMNSAATGNSYDATITNPASPAWDTSGAFYVPYMGRNDYLLVANRIIKGWTNISFASLQGRALKLSQANYGEVSSADSFNPGSAFALEAWIQPAVTNSKQIIMTKTGSYALYINTQSQVCLDVIIRQDSGRQNVPPIITTHTIASNITAGQTSYVAVNFTSGSNPNEEGSKEYVKQTYYLNISLYINGVQAQTYSKNDYTRSIAVDNKTTSFLLGISAEKTFSYQGLISHVRVWNKVLAASDILETYNLHQKPQNTDGLVAGWNFTEQSGKIAADINQSIDMQLSSNQLWALWQDVAQGQIYVNGQLAFARRAHASDYGGYGASQQFIFGGLNSASGMSLPFNGQLDEVRLYSTCLTVQQVHESMHKPLTGTEEYLAAYWPIDAGSGSVVYDLRGTGNNGTLMPVASPPVWQPSSAPIKNEGQSVLNVINGRADNFIARINGEPSVIEYASSENDAYGNLYSVQKRGYFFLSADGNSELETGYKVGDLDTIYLGQVQSEPSVVGFIEGAPPIPSENQTLAYWSGDMGGPAKAYEAITSVTYQESESKTWTFKASQSRAFTGAFTIKGGFYLTSETDISAGLGLESGTKVLKNKIKIGAKNSESGDIGSTDSVTETHSSTASLSNTLAPSGGWEPASAILNPAVGRRYIQNNTGSAVVKSATADLFMVALKGTQTPVGYVLSPNKNIPIDTNIIHFPINPKYIKNGTLDGKVGLVNDPDYPQANSERGSYFKPIEAYAMKRKIEKQEQQLAAYYDQFDANKYRVLDSLDNVKDKLKSNPAYDFNNKINQRSICNNYVWTASGGLHKEEHSVANSYTEEYVGNSSFKFAAGAEINADLGSPFGGYYIEADVMLGGSWSMTASKASLTSNAFSLSCIVAPTGFLQAPKMTTDASGQLKFNGYDDAPAAGKVDGYRYMAFMLAPSKENYTALSQVIDPNWLHNSTSAAAAALRTAKGAENGSWRIMYRTTYVSRIPASFQPVKDDTNAPNITLPANLEANSWLITIIQAQITQPAPSPLDIGSAIDEVLGTQNQRGLLYTLIAWWPAFCLAAEVYGSTEFIELAELRIDLLNYMVSLYEAKKYQAS